MPGADVLAPYISAIDQDRSVDTPPLEHAPQAHVVSGHSPYGAFLSSHLHHPCRRGLTVREHNLIHVTYARAVRGARLRITSHDA